MYNKFDDPNMLGNWVSKNQEKLADRYIVGVDLANPKTYTLELTQEELDFIHERCSRKAHRLEEANLMDIPCYRLSWQVMSKISKVKKEQEDKKDETAS